MTLVSHPVGAMDCIEFRERYSEFADGFLDEAAEVGMCRHLAECDACRRFDAAYTLGAKALRGLPLPTPSRDFDRRLTERIARACLDPEPVLRQSTGLAGAVLVAAVLAVAGWELMDRAPARTTASSSGFVVRFAGDTSIEYPGKLPIIPVPRDTFRTPAKPAPSFQIAVDYMVVP